MAFRKGLVLTFGMVNVIVSADSMKDKESSLVSVCCGITGAEHDPTQVKQKLWCITCEGTSATNDGTVAYADLKKAEVIGDSFKVIPKEAVSTAKDSVLGATKKMMSVIPHPADEVSVQMLQGDSVYLLTPEGAPQIGAYSLVLDAVERHPEVAFLVRWTPTSKVSTYQLQAFRGALVMRQLCEPEAVRAIAPIDTIEPSTDHQTMVDTLLTSMVQPFDADLYANKGAAALADVLATVQAVAGVTLDKEKAAPKLPSTGGGLDLTAALNAMLAQATPAKPTKKKVSA